MIIRTFVFFKNDTSKIVRALFNLYIEYNSNIISFYMNVVIVTMLYIYIYIYVVKLESSGFASRYDPRCNHFTLHILYTCYD